MAGFGPDKVAYPQLTSNPTGADGDAYYNSADGVFRFKAEGTWVDVGQGGLDGSTAARAAPSGTYLYDNFGLLTYYGSNQEIVFKIAPSSTISEEDIDYLFESLVKTLEKGWVKIIGSFVNRKILSILPLPK